MRLFLLLLERIFVTQLLEAPSRLGSQEEKALLSKCVKYYITKAHIAACAAMWLKNFSDQISGLHTRYEARGTSRSLQGVLCFPSFLCYMFNSSTQLVIVRKEMLGLGNASTAVPVRFMV